MNILLIDHYAGSINHGMEYRPYYLAREWVKSGHNVKIVAASFSHYRAINPSVSQIITEEKIGGVNYIWLRTNRYTGNHLGRIISIISFIFRVYFNRKKILKDFNPDVIIASSTYPLDIYPAYIISKRTKAKLVYEVHDLWPLSPIELGNMSKYNPLIIIIQIAENFAYRKSDKVISLLPKTKTYMVEHGMDPVKFEYIPNGIDMDEWEVNNLSLPPEHVEVLTGLKQRNQFIVGYTGAHGLANVLHHFISTGKLLENYPVTILLVGEGQEKEKLMKRAEELNLKNVLFLPAVPKASVPKLLSYIDVLYIGLKAEPLFRFGISPNKLIDYMMSAKPVIQAIDAGNDMVSESGCGFSITPENSEAIADAIIKFFNMDVNDRIIMGLKGRKYIEKEHDYKLLAKKFTDAITK
jgi:glycosyltransferase involved in cell wall biosynthesis